MLVYVILKPLTFPSIDYPCYGSFTPESDSTVTSVGVSLIPSGRLSKHSIIETVELEFDSLRNEVTAEEAPLGTGTYIGSHVAVVHASASGGRSWTYGLVVDSDHGALYVLQSSAKQPVRMEIQPTSVCLVNALNMCMQVVSGLSTVTMRVGDVMARHDALSVAWASIPISSKRSISTHKIFLKDVGISKMPSEDDRIPCWDPFHGKPIWHSVSQVLDFSFYTEGGRSPPNDRLVLDSLAATLVEPGPMGTTTPTKPRRKTRAKSPKSPIKNVSFQDAHFELVDEEMTISEDEDGDVLEKVAQRKVVVPLPSVSKQSQPAVASTLPSQPSVFGPPVSFVTLLAIVWIVPTMRQVKTPSSMP